MSISVSAEDLKVLSSRARRVHGGNVSAVVHEMVDAIKRLEAADELLATIGGDRLNEKDLQQIRDEVSAAFRPGVKRKSVA